MMSAFLKLRLHPVLFLTLLIALVFTLGFAHADTLRVKVRPDEEVRFQASTSGTTRVSVVADRILKIIQSDSNFEMVNDEGTGDIFLRAVAPTAEEETGYLVTEAGHTIAFRMVPSKRVDMQTVLITIVGAPGKKSNASSSAPSANSPFVVDGGGSAGGNRIAGLVSSTRQAIAKQIGVKSVSKQRVGTLGTVKSGGLVAIIKVAAAPSGTPPSPQSFYRSSKTLAVWVDDVVHMGKVWVVVVESAK